MSTDALRRCSPTMPRDWKRLMSPCCACGRSLYCPQVCECGLRKLKPDGTGQCLYLVRYCSQTTRKSARFMLPARDGRRCLPRSTKGMFVYCTSTLLSESGKASVYSGPTLRRLWVKQRTPTNNNNNPTSFSTLQVLVRGSFVLGEAISLKCNLVIVLVLGSCGTLARSRAPYVFYLLPPSTHNELLVQLVISFQDDGEPEDGQSVQGPFIARLRLYGIQALWVHVVTAQCISNEST